MKIDNVHNVDEKNESLTHRLCADGNASTQSMVPHHYRAANAPTARRQQKGSSVDTRNWRRTENESMCTAKEVIDEDINMINNEGISALLREETVNEDARQCSNRAPFEMRDIPNERITGTPLSVETNAVSTNSISTKLRIEILDKMDRENANESHSIDGQTGFGENSIRFTVYVYSLSLSFDQCIPALAL